MTAKKATAQRKSPVKSSESDDSVEGGGIEAAVKAAATKVIPSPYPEGTGIFSYQPQAEGSDPILLPTTGIRPGDKVWHFDLAQLPILAQTWKWMERANVPKNIQRQCQFLPDAEYFKMFDGWLDAIKEGQAPKGAVTAGK